MRGPTYFLVAQIEVCAALKEKDMNKVFQMGEWDKTKQEVCQSLVRYNSHFETGKKNKTKRKTKRDNNLVCDWTLKGQVGKVHVKPVSVSVWEIRSHN